MLVPLAIDEQVGALSLILCSHERVVDILIDELFRSRHLRSHFYIFSMLCKEIGYLHQFIIVAICRIDELVYLYFSPIGILCLGTEPLVLTLSYKPACLAEFIFGHEGEVGLSLSDVAVAAPLNGVWVVVGHGLLLLPGLNQNIPFVSLCSASSPRAMASSRGVVAYFDFRTCTTVHRQFHPLGG